MYLKHGSSLVTDAIVTPSNYKMMRPKKVKVMVTSNLTNYNKVQCQDCRRLGEFTMVSQPIRLI